MMGRKLVSFCLVSYNQEAYVSEALLGAISQKYSPLEIIVSDDCSTDATFDVIKDIVNNYKGPHKIITNRNQKNLGLGEHFSKAVGLCSGAYIITLGGDDISLDGHVEKGVKALEENPDMSMVDFSGQIIDADSNFISNITIPFTEKKFYLSDYLSVSSIHSFAPGRIIKRELISDFGPISKNCPTEDSVIVLRSLLAGGFMRADLKLVLYRKHQNNISNENNLRKMSNLAIVSQYYLDVLKYYNDGLLDENTCIKVLDRIKLEYRIRNSRNTIKKNTISFFAQKIHLRLAILKYKYQTK